MNLGSELNSSTVKTCIAIIAQMARKSVRDLLFRAEVIMFYAYSSTVLLSWYASELNDACRNTNGDGNKMHDNLYYRPLENRGVTIGFMLPRMILDIPKEKNENGLQAEWKYAVNERKMFTNLRTNESQWCVTLPERWYMAMFSRDRWGQRIPWYIRNGVISGPKQTAGNCFCL